MLKLKIFCKFKLKISHQSLICLPWKLKPSPLYMVTWKMEIKVVITSSDIILPDLPAIYTLWKQQLDGIYKFVIFDCNLFIGVVSPPSQKSGCFYSVDYNKKDLSYCVGWVFSDFLLCLVWTWWGDLSPKPFSGPTPALSDEGRHLEQISKLLFSLIPSLERWGATIDWK